VLATATLVAAAASAAPSHRPVRTIEIRYRAHDGVARRAYVLLPASYTRAHDPAIPLVISPHGRGVSGRANARLWGTLPARGDFAVISPAGEGRKLSRYSWGSAGQIDDLARMPVILHLALPWVHVDRSRIFAIGGSMGGQETLLLLARHPRLLAGAAAFDAVTRFALQYRRFPRMPCDRGCRKTWHGSIGVALQSLARQEIGGSPKTRPLAYLERSPFTYARTIAASCVPLQLWWSTKDRIVADQRQQSDALYRRLRKLNARAPVSAFVGTWRHSAEMRDRLPAALASFGLLPELNPLWLRQLHTFTGPDAADCRAGT